MILSTATSLYAAVEFCHLEGDRRVQDLAEWEQGSRLTWCGGRREGVIGEGGLAAQCVTTFSGVLSNKLKFVTTLFAYNC